MLSASNCANLGNGLSREVSSSFNPTYFNIEIGPLVKQQPLQPKQIQISYDWFLDYHGSGVVIFTSGTTGPPKGYVSQGHKIWSVDVVGPVPNRIATEVVWLGNLRGLYSISPLETGYSYFSSKLDDYSFNPLLTLRLVTLEPCEEDRGWMVTRKDWPIYTASKLAMS